MQVNIETTSDLLELPSPDSPKLMQLSSSDELNSEESTDSYVRGSTTSESDYVAEEDRSKIKLKLIMEDCKQHSKLLLGLPNELHFLLEKIEERKITDYRSVLVVLSKIRHNESFAYMAIRFGSSQATIGRIFRNNIQKVYSCFIPFVTWPSSSLIRLNLPIPFRIRHHNLNSIIDCFEVAIEKPTSAVQQSATWSSYKNSNTIKFLISITPDGIINYISDGFGGRTSDRAILENSSYLDVVPENSAILADRGFKQVQSILAKKKCTLIRPPSASSTQKLSAKDVFTGRRIASLRIHVERAICRLRDFKLLEPYTFVDHNLIRYLDYVAGIACGLVNLQTPIINN